VGAAQSGGKARAEKHSRGVKKKERCYFLEELYPEYGNLVPGISPTRAIHHPIV